MRANLRIQRWVVLSCLLSSVFFSTSGCSTEAILGGAGGATFFGARSPSHEIEQTYYLGVFDPDDQVPPSLYRLTVHGQASAISLIRFASGWVPAPLIDSLNTRIQFKEKDSELEISTGDGALKATLTPGRRLILFGPEGFREAPKDHRLVIVMGSSPQKYFNAVDQVLGAIAAAKREQSLTPDDKRRIIIAALLELSDEQERLAILERELKK